MGRKDSCEKEFVSDNRIFADIINGAVFSGKQVVKPEDLSEPDTTEVFADTVGGIKLSSQKYRDVVMPPSADVVARWRHHE